VCQPPRFSPGSAEQSAGVKIYFVNNQWVKPHRTGGNKHLTVAKHYKCKSLSFKLSVREMEKIAVGRDRSVTHITFIAEGVMG
jgi:hypothetical protein